MRKTDRQTDQQTNREPGTQTNRDETDRDGDGRKRQDAGETGKQRDARDRDRVS